MARPSGALFGKSAENKGYEVNVFIMSFHSSKPQNNGERTTTLVDLIKKINPLFIGLSVMASLI